MTRLGFASVLLLAVAGASGAAAKDSPGLRYDGALNAACLDDGGWRDCIGRASDACVEATEGGYSTVGMMGCMAADLEWWDADLNARYAEVMARQRAADADRQSQPSGTTPPLGVDMLRDMQRNWMAFRDSTCDFQELQWWGGTGARLAGTACRMQMTAEQALVLRTYLAEG